MARYMGSLSAYDAAFMAQEALSNAEELLRDARILFEHERYSRAMALAVIAIEEVAKWSIVQDGFPATHDGDWKRFWVSVRSHSTKIDKHHSFILLETLRAWGIPAPLTFYLNLPETAGETPEEEWTLPVVENEGDLQIIKESCLYVDHDGKSVSSPCSRHSDRAECERILSRAEDYVNHIYRPLPPLDAWAETLEQRRVKQSRSTE